jgi:dolichyl-diphosphooligosaccharide--protein glycosyltransferase
MSQSRGYLDDNPELDAALDRVKEWYHIPALVLVIGFMLWNRVQNYSNYIVDGEVIFSGTDPWYHYRSTMYVVNNWPSTMPFDPWTYFPYGNRSGQFGTLMDQVFGTIALIIGLGSPSDHTVAMVALFAPAVMGALAAIPTYYIGKRLGGRVAGVTAILVLGLSAGTFLQRSVVGVYDHQVAEGLLQVTSVLAVMVAISVAERDKPIYEQFVERDVPALRATVGYSLLAGFVISLYFWTWPPAVLLIGILGVFFLLWLTIEFVRGKSPEHVAIAGAIIMGTVAVLQLAVVKTVAITAVDHSLLQPLLALVVGGGCLFMAWLARYMETEGYDRNLYPVTVGGIIVVGSVLMAILTPDLFSYFIDQILRVVGFTQSPSLTQTSVGEATPFRDPLQTFFEGYGLSLYVAAIGAILVLFQQFTDREASAELFLVVVWAAFILAASFTQRRFAVYLVFPVASLTALTVSRVIGWTDFTLDTDIELYEVLTVGAVAVAIFGTLVLVSPTALAVGGSVGPGTGPAAWSESLEWVDGNTPEEGAYGTGGNGTLDYYGTYQNREDFDYQEGEYGVMSWWDYGHIITVQGERIPNANPFQQGSGTAADFLLAPNESEANAVLEDVDEDDAETRYVATDWQMANTYSTLADGKFFAPIRFTDRDVSESDYWLTVRDRQNPQRYFHVRGQDYYNSTVIRLYQFHGSAREPQPVVIDWELASTQRGQQFRATPSDGPTLRTFDSMEEAEAFVEEDGSARIGGFGAFPNERVPAMEHYRYVGSSETSAYASSDYNRARVTEALFLEPIRVGQVPQNRTDCGEGATTLPVNSQRFCLSDSNAELLSGTHPAWTKIHERVPGATIEGTGPANETVTAAVPMENDVTGETFTYRQQVRTDSEGNFEMTVPYSTTGYDEYGTDAGYTNVSVRANGPYEFTVERNGFAVPLNGTTHVTEGQVVGENETASTVTLTADESIPELNPGDSSTGDSSDDSTTDGGSSGDGSSGDGSTEGTPTGTATPSGAIADPTAAP